MVIEINGGGDGGKTGRTAGTLSFLRGWDHLWFRSWRRFHVID